MIEICKDYKELFKQYHSVDDFLKIDIDTVRDFKNRKTGRFEIDGKGFYIKKHFACGHMAVLDELFHLRKPHIGAIHESHALDRLTEIDIDTMEVIAFGVEGNTLAGQRSFLVTKELTDIESLEDICGKWKASPPYVIFKRAILNRVAEIAAIIHQAGLNHRDFYICHFMLDIAGEYLNRSPKLFLIDLHRAQQRKEVPFRWRVKDISGLYFSAMDIGLNRNDVFRFMKIYTGKSLKETLSEDKAFWRAVQNRAIRTYRRDFGKSPLLIVNDH